MKIGVVFFHKNLNKIYRKEWIEKCIDSIKNQTYKNLVLYEIDYGNSETNLTGCNNFFSLEKENYADAMNFIITEAFNDGCNYVFNTNMDDIFTLDRIEKQLEYLNKGYDLVTSDFMYIDEDDTFKQNMIHSPYNYLIKEHLNNNHNIIAHPSVGYSKNFWDNNKYDITKTPEEDLDLWRRAINNGYTFYIVPEILLLYRIHGTQVSNKN
jgi:GT2 family glycosyltransferase